MHILATDKDIVTFIHLQAISPMKKAGDLLDHQHRPLGRRSDHRHSLQSAATPCGQSHSHHECQRSSLSDRIEMHYHRENKARLSHPHSNHDGNVLVPEQDGWDFDIHVTISLEYS